MDKELQRQQRARDSQLQATNEAKEWISKITGKPVINFFEDLQNGVILCELMNQIFTGIIPHFAAKPKHPLEENINSFLKACHQVGVPHQDLITLLDMGQRRDEIQLLHCISAIQRQSQAMGLKVPTFGPTYYRTIEDQEKIEAKRKLEAQEFAKKKERQERRNLARRTELEKLEKRQRKIQEAKEMMVLRQNARAADLAKADLAMHGSVVVMADLQKMEGSTIKYGYDLEIEEKAEANRDHQLEMDVLDWIEDVTGEVVDHVWLHLKSGRKLCKLANCISPGIISRVNKRKIAIMERLFLSACVGLGVSSQDLFEVDNLYNATSLKSVIHTLYCLAVATNRADDLHALRNEARIQQRQPKLSAEIPAEPSIPLRAIEPQKRLAPEASPAPQSQQTTIHRSGRPPAPLPPKQPSNLTAPQTKISVPRFRDSAHLDIVQGNQTAAWVIGAGVTLLVATPFIGFVPLAVAGASYLAYSTAQYFKT